MKILNVRLFQKLLKQSPSSLLWSEDSPTNGLYHLLSVRWPCSSLKVTTASRTWQRLNLYYNSHISECTSAMASKLGMCMAYLLMLMTLILMHGYNGLSKAKIQCWIMLTTRQATSIELAATVGHFFYVTLTLQTFIFDHLVFVFVWLLLCFQMCCIILLVLHHKIGVSDVTRCVVLLCYITACVAKCCDSTG